MIVSWLADLGAGIADADDAALLTERILAAQAGDGVALLNACRQIGEAADPETLVASLAAADDLDPVASLAAIVMQCFAAVRIDYRSRQDASAARTALGQRADAAYPTLDASWGPDVLDWLLRLVGVTVIELSAIGATRAPLVRVETGLSLPSSLIAWDLYGDPERGAELVDRNQVRTPLAMPVALEALAS